MFIDLIINKDCFVLLVDGDKFGVDFDVDVELWGDFFRSLNVECVVCGDDVGEGVGDVVVGVGDVRFVFEDGDGGVFGEVWWLLVVLWWNVGMDGNYLWWRCVV